MWKVETNRQEGKRFLSPASIMLLTLLFIVLLQAASAYIFTHQPWTGMKLDADPDSGFLRVMSVAENSPADGIIHSDTVLYALQTESGNPVNNFCAYRLSGTWYPSDLC
ncbi:MAG: hypothetical protein R3E95_24295 [Thiolinea sp.]